MAQFLLGKRASSARYACLFCLFSDNPNHSHPDVERSIATLTAESVAAAVAVREGRVLHPGDYNSSAGTPIPTFIADSQQHLKELFPIAQLHMFLSGVATFIDEARRVDRHITDTFLLRLNVLSNKKHGFTDFSGPECHRILKGLDNWMRMIGVVAEEAE